MTDDLYLLAFGVVVLIVIVALVVVDPATGPRVDTETATGSSVDTETTRDKDGIA